MLYKLKGPFQKLSEKFLKSGMTANQASAGGILFILLICFTFYWPSVEANQSWLYGFAPVFIFFRMVMNALDGLLARRLNTASVAGEVFNELSDVVGDTLNYGVLVFVFPQHIAQIVIVIIGIWFCEFAAILGKSLPKGFRRQESFGGAKPERAVYLGLIAILLAIKIDSLIEKVGIFLWVIGALVFATGFYRIISSIRDAKGSNYESKTLYGR